MKFPHTREEDKNKENIISDIQKLFNDIATKKGQSEQEFLKEYQKKDYFFIPTYLSATDKLIELKKRLEEELCNIQL